MNVANIAVFRNDEGQLIGGRASSGSVASVSAPSGHAMGTPTPVREMGDIMRGDLGLCRDSWLRQDSNFLNNKVLLSVDDILLVRLLYFAWRN